MIRKKMMHLAEASEAVLMPSTDFNLTMEALWDGQSYNFKPHVQQSHDRVHFEEGCKTSWMNRSDWSFHLRRITRRLVLLVIIHLTILILQKWVMLLIFYLN